MAIPSTGLHWREQK